MSAPFRPWFQYGFAGDLEELTLRWPMRHWTPATGGVGGSATAASGIPEAYKIRRDRIARLELRVEEDELPFFESFLDWARDSGQTFHFRFDVDVPATDREVYLHSPRWEDAQEVDYSRTPEFPTVFLVPIAIRRASAVPWGITWGEFPDEEL